MAQYFDYGQHKTLVPAPLRLRQREIIDLAPCVEAEIIESFTRSEPPPFYGDPGEASSEFYTASSPPAAQVQRYVYLLRYTVDADDCIDAGFKEAMADCVARVVAWRLHQQEINPLLAAESGAGASEQIAGEIAHRPFPPGYPFRLKHYDTRVYFPTYIL